MKLLTVENAKTVKDERLGYLTGILYLAPANESRVMNVCPYATDECKLQGLHKATSFKLAEFIRRDQLPIVREYIAFKGVRGKKRMTGEQFCKLYPSGRYLLRLAHHITAVVNGNLIDTWDCSRKCVYGAWRVRWGHAVRNDVEVSRVQ